MLLSAEVVVSDRAPCVRCGAILHTGEGRVIVAFSADELVVIIQTEEITIALRRRLLCALQLIDPDRADSLA